MSWLVKVNSPMVLYELGLNDIMIGLGRSFYTAEVFGAAFKIKNLSNMKKSKIFGKLLGGSKRKKWHTDIAVPKLPGLIESPIATKGPNTSRRANVLNALFMGHITDVMSTGEIGASLQGYGIEITKVKVSCDYTFLSIYWLIADCTASRDKEAEKLLIAQASPIRQHLTSLRLMGHVPKVVFVRDKTYTNIAEVERRLAIADFGPDEEPSTADEQNCVTEDIPEVQEDENDGVILPADMRQDIFGLNHKRFMEEVIQLSKKAKAQHRTSNSPYIFHETSQPKSRPTSTYPLTTTEVGTESAIRDFMRVREIEQNKLRKRMRLVEDQDIDEREETIGQNDEDANLDENDDFEDTNQDWYKKEL